MADIDTAVADTLAEWGVSFKARYVGESKRDDDPIERPLDRWVIAFIRGSVKKDFDFYTGLGNRGFPTHGAELTARWEARTRCPGLTQKDITHRTILGRRYLDELEKRKKPVKPSAASVLYCLLLDSEASSQSFGDWCSDFGYSTDSITALKTYHACQEEGDKLRALFSGAQIEAIRELLQDY